MLVAPVYRSLILPNLIFGVPRQLAIMLLMFTLGMVVSLGQYWFLAVTVLLFLVFNILGRSDPMFFDMFVQLVKLPEVAD
jgi:type IV secretory pathway VirB3-like protein